MAISVTKRTIFERVRQRDDTTHIHITFEVDGESAPIVIPVARVEAGQTADQVADIIQADLENRLKENEWVTACELALETGVNPVNLVYKYHTKTEVLTRLKDKLDPLAVQVSEKLSRIQTTLNRINLFLSSGS